MAGQPRQLDELLRALTRGDPGAITEAELARIEAALDADPTLANTLAAEPAGRHDPLVAAVERAASAGPTAAEWEQVWQNISTGAAEAVRPAVASRARRLLRLRVPLAAAAAVLLAVGAWWGWSARTSDEWEIQLAADVQIDDIDLPDDTTPAVIRLGPGGPTVIWVLEDMSG